VEVGIDVPNATIMIVEHAERFGLSQLHQLRGRVGRSLHQSYCCLVYQSPLSEDARSRLKAMTETTDGFVIAERDLALRGPGDFFGTRQAGLPTFRLIDLVRDQDALAVAQREAAEWLDQSPPTPAALTRLLDIWHTRFRLIEIG
jgi:ATP-dependent DNA helicase RecG